MLKVLILADKRGWVIERVVDEIINGTPCEFKKVYYSEINSEDLLKMSQDYDLIHYANWDLTFHRSILSRIKKPMLVGVMSHRYPIIMPDFAEVVKEHRFYLQVLNKKLLKDFPDARCIAYGISPEFRPHKEFVVGFSGIASEYKGFNLIKQACEELGVQFKPATGDVPPDQMPEYYKSIDLLVSASIDEGFCWPLYECMAMNIPVITTDTGGSEDLNIIKIERSVEGIKAGILKFYTRPQVEAFTWDKMCKQYLDYYYHILTTEGKKTELPQHEIERLEMENRLLNKEHFNHLSQSD